MSSDFDARRQKATAFVSLGESSESLGVRESIADGYATVQRGGGGGGGGARDNESNTVAPLFFFSPFFPPLHFPPDNSSDRATLSIPSFVRTDIKCPLRGSCPHHASKLVR